MPSPYATAAPLIGLPVNASLTTPVIEPVAGVGVGVAVGVAVAVAVGVGVAVPVAVGVAVGVGSVLFVVNSALSTPATLEFVTALPASSVVAAVKIHGVRIRVVWYL